MKEDITNLSAAVIYDVLALDLKFKEPFLLDTNIKLISGKKIFGPAFTVQGKYMFNRTDNYVEMAKVIEMLEHIPTESIEVLSCGYSGPVASWGDFTASLVAKYGCIGAVTDGFTRDVKGLNEMDFSLFCKGTCCINGFGSGWQIVDYLCPIEMPGHLGTKVKITPDDYIFGDDDGVLLIPGNLIEQILELGDKRLKKEEFYKKKIKNNDFSIEEMKKSIFEW